MVQQIWCNLQWKAGEEDSVELWECDDGQNLVEYRDLRMKNSKFTDEDEKRWSC